MKIINVDDKPFDWTFAGDQYGPIAPGQIMDLPDEVAMHAVRRSVVHDDVGEFVRHRVELLSSVDRDTIRRTALIECPYKLANQCDAAPFKSEAELKAHLEGHWELSPEPVPSKVPAQAQGARK